MKKISVILLALTLVFTAAYTHAESTESFFKSFAGIEWSFSSGVGAWSTDMRILADGSFSGEFHDSEMGESAAEYPYGTVYGCSFTGQMSYVERIDEYTCKILINRITMDEGQAREAIDDGIRYVTTEPYGICEGDTMVLYRPGTPVSMLSEEMRMWAHLMDHETSPTELEAWFLYSAKNDSGFVGFRMDDFSGLANPWEDITAEQLSDITGFAFGVPDIAENVIYRYLRSENLAEMQFTMDGDELCARIQPAVLREGELQNISGMYFAWENEESVEIGHCYGTIGQAQTGSEDWVELCLWYDSIPGLMYSLSVSTTDLDGLDLMAIAEQIYIPVQGNN